MPRQYYTAQVVELDDEECHGTFIALVTILLEVPRFSTTFIHSRLLGFGTQDPMKQTFKQVSNAELMSTVTQTSNAVSC